MSLKAKLEAVIYAAEEPVTLAQLAALFADDALEWKAEQEAAAAARAAELQLDRPRRLQSCRTLRRLRTWSLTDSRDGDSAGEQPRTGCEAGAAEPEAAGRSGSECRRSERGGRDEAERAG